MALDTHAAFALPDDHEQATLVGRVWRPELDGILTQYRKVDTLGHYELWLRGSPDATRPAKP